MMDGSNSKFVNLINAGEYNGYTIRDNLPTDLVDYSSVVFDSFDGSIVDTPDDTEAPYSSAAQAAFYAAIVQGKQYGMVYDFELPTAISLAQRAPHIRQSRHRVFLNKPINIEWNRPRFPSIR